MILWVYLFKDKKLNIEGIVLNDVEKLIIDYTTSSLLITTKPISYFKSENKRPINLEGTWTWVIDFDDIENNYTIQYGIFISPEIVNTYWKNFDYFSRKYQRSISINDIFYKNVLKDEFLLKKGLLLNYFLNLIFEKKHFNIIASTDYYLYSDALIVQKFIESRP